LHPRPFKRQCLDDTSSLVEEFTPFWDRLWNKQVNFVEAVTVIRDLDPVEDLDDIPSTIQVLHGLPKVLLSNNNGVFIRKQYDAAHDVLKSSCTTHSAVIITGQPGIGKTMFLYYILAFRLHNKQPTFFQFRKDFIILFNDSVASVPEIFIESAYFVVIATPPHPRRWKSIQHYRPDIKMWFMEPFTLEELIQARSRECDRHKLKEQDIQAFFEKYGPSARECFGWCSDLEYYDKKIRARITSVLGYTDKGPNYRSLERRLE